MLRTALHTIAIALLGFIATICMMAVPCEDFSNWEMAVSQGDYTWEFYFFLTKIIAIVAAVAACKLYGKWFADELAADDDSEW